MKRKILFMLFILFMAESAFSLSYACVGGRGPVISSIENVSGSEIYLENEASFDRDQVMQEGLADLRMYGEVVNSFYQNRSDNGIKSLDKAEINRFKLKEVFSFSKDLIRPEKIDEGDLLVSGPPGICSRSVKAVFSKDGKLKYADVDGRFANNVVTEKRRVTVSGLNSNSAEFDIGGGKFSLGSGEIKTLRSDESFRLKLQEVEPVNRPGIDDQEPVRYNANYAFSKVGEKQKENQRDDSLVELVIRYLSEFLN